MAKVISFIFILIIVYYIFRSPKDTAILLKSTAGSGSGLIGTLQGRKVNFGSGDIQVQ